MARRKPTPEDLEDRKVLAEEFRKFMKMNLFTEVKLADVLQISRRTVQMIKAGSVSPHPGTLRKWNALVARYKSGQGI